jgi:hypothetical protein
MKTRCQGSLPGEPAVRVRARKVRSVACIPPRRRQPSSRGRDRPSFRCETPCPTRFPGLVAHGSTRGHRRHRGRAEGIADASGGGKASRRLRSQAKAACDGLDEGSLFHAEAGGLKVRPISQQGIQQPAEPMSHGDDRDLVATASTQFHEVRMERMAGSPGMRAASHSMVRSSAEPVW